MEALGWIAEEDITSRVPFSIPATLSIPSTLFRRRDRGQPFCTSEWLLRRVGRQPAPCLQVCRNPRARRAPTFQGAVDHRERRGGENERRPRARKRAVCCRDRELR